MPALLKTLLEDNFVQLHVGKAVHNEVQSQKEPRPQQVAMSLMQFGNLFQFAMKCRSRLVIKLDYVWHDVKLAGKELEPCEGAGSVRDHERSSLLQPYGDYQIWFHPARSSNLTSIHDSDKDVANLYAVSPQNKGDHL